MVQNFSICGVFIIIIINEFICTIKTRGTCLGLLFLKKYLLLSFQNPNAHVRWTSKQILAQKPDINVFCAGMGTSGTMTGTGSALKR